MGLVLGGCPVSYREIEEETGFARKTLERWMRVLRREGYVVTQAVPSGVIVRITKAKKWAPTPAHATEQIAIPFVERFEPSGALPTGTEAILLSQYSAPRPAGPPTVEGENPAPREPRGVALESGEPQRRFADGSPHYCGSDGTQVTANEADATRIGSGFIVRGNRDHYLRPTSEEKLQLQNKSQTAQPRDNSPQDRPASAKSWRFARTWERDEAVRRELNVGAGPECRRRGK